MPWYWSDDMAQSLLESGRAHEAALSAMISRPVAYRVDFETVEQAAEWLAEEDEIPLAA